jgi:hypothetical protein
MDNSLVESVRPGGLGRSSKRKSAAGEEESRNLHLKGVMDLRNEELDGSSELNGMELKTAKLILRVPLILLGNS